MKATPPLLKLPAWSWVNAGATVSDLSIEPAPSTSLAMCRGVTERPHKEAGTPLSHESTVNFTLGHYEINGSIS